MLLSQCRPVGSLARIVVRDRLAVHLLGTDIRPFDEMAGGADGCIGIEAARAGAVPVAAI